MATERRAFTRARRNAEIAMERAEQERKIKMLQRRIELAQSGVKAYEARRINEAVKAFHTYLKILEEWKGVGEGKLSPANFDLKADVAELLLISGVYWDLTKLYDRTQSPDKQREFMHYMEKYIMFSKGMPFQHVCVETLRKYISADKPIHKEEFKNAFKLLGGTNCFVATALMDVCDERTLPTLRRFRDETLRESASGRSFIAWYYRNGPRMAQATDHLPQAVRKAMGLALDCLARVLP